MTKFKRVLSDGEIFELLAVGNDIFNGDSEGDIYATESGLSVDWESLLELFMKFEQTILTKLAEQDHVAAVRYLMGGIDLKVADGRHLPKGMRLYAAPVPAIEQKPSAWFIDDKRVCGNRIITDPEIAGDWLETDPDKVTPLYAHPSPSNVSDKTACVSKAEGCEAQHHTVRCNDCWWHGEESDLVLAMAVDHPDNDAVPVCPQCKKLSCLMNLDHNEQQMKLAKELYRSTKNHIPNARKMVAPHGYRLVSLADIDTAIQRASVFDDGGVGADPKCARSCIEILKSMISSKAIDYLEPKKEVVHDRHTGRELLYFPPVGESLYSMAQARKESFSLALSVDTKKVQALLQSYLDSLEGWQLVPKQATNDMYLSFCHVRNDIEPDEFREAYRAVLEGAPKYEGK